MIEKLMPRLSKNKKIPSVNYEKPTPPQVEIAIDYPREEELLVPGHYAVRLSGLPEAQVEVSINDGEWQGCRTAIGYYWFDWQPVKAGEYVLMARLRVGKGRWKNSDQRYCRVVINGKKN